MNAHVEHGFRLFNDEELRTGLAHAAKKDHVTLDYARLRTIANDAGKTRLNAAEKLRPRDAAARAVKAFLRQYPGVKLRESHYEGYVHAIAKMMSGRNPATRAKRERDANVAEILAISHNIESTPDMDPEINRQLALGLTGSITEEQADTH